MYRLESKLIPNPCNTYFLLIVSKLQWEKILNNVPCFILRQDTSPSAIAKNCSVLFDSSLNFWIHLSQPHRSCFYHICELHKIWKNLSIGFVKQIALALVKNKLEYCNALFQNIPEKDIARLQHIQNCLARVITKGPRFSHSVPILKQSHWLHIKFGIDFEIYEFLSPKYLADFLVQAKCSQYPRSTN